MNRIAPAAVELIPGGAKKFLSVTRAKALLATVRPRDVVGKTRRRLAAELVVELDGIDKEITAASTDLTEPVGATGSTLLELHRIGPGQRAATPSARLL